MGKARAKALNASGWMRGFAQSLPKQRRANPSQRRHPRAGAWVRAAVVCLTMHVGAAAAQLPLSGATQVQSGASHTCVLTSSGGMKCWGLNGSGQLGDNSTSSRISAVDVTGLGSGVVAIAGGQSHTCALTAAGAVKCWGRNTEGQLGNNSTAQRLTAVDVSGLGSGVAAITAGDEHSCALTDAGAVKCWGSNDFGQLGDNSTTRRLTAVDVVGLASGIVAITAGRDHTCALGDTGGVKCWGRNTSGQLGDNSTTQRLTPVDTHGLTEVTAIAAGWNHTCALTSSGGVKCWGYNYSGQLGDDSTTLRLAAVDVIGLSSGVIAIAAGLAHTCALSQAGGVKCWGLNDDGQLGDNSITQRLTAVDVPGLGSDVLSIAAGGLHTCALRDAGLVMCWGANDSGQLGDNTSASRAKAVDVVGLTEGTVAFSAAPRHSCVLTDAGGVKCWGRNFYGELGDNSNTQRLTAVDVVGLGSGVDAVAGGGSHTCALLASGGVKCWGFRNLLGSNATADSFTPVDVAGLSSGVQAIAAGEHHTCALTNAGGVQCWGNNPDGQLGDGSRTRRLVPVQVSGLTSGVTSISAGTGHTCAVASGSVKCWGNNLQGQLGTGAASAAVTLPADVVGLASGVTAVAAGGEHTCALTDAGALKCWGDNNSGQLGDDGYADRLTPMDVPGMGTGTAKVAAGRQHTCALTSSGGAKCWGSDWDGQIGDGEGITHRRVPTDVLGLASGVVDIDAGDAHNCAVVAGGGAKCWGDNRFGQLGIGTATFRPYPAIVLQAATVPGRPLSVSGVAGDGAAVVSFSPPASDGGAAITAFTVTSTPGGVLSDGCTASPCTVSGLENGTTYTFTVAAINAVGTGPESDSSNSVTPKGTQTITFDAPDTKRLGSAPFSVSASGGASGNPVTFASLALQVCVTGGSDGATVSLLAAGTCTLRASQAGSSGYNPATAVDRSFDVAPAAANLAVVADPRTALAGEAVLLVADVSGVQPSGSIAFLADGQPLPGCDAQPLAGSGDSRSAQCTATGLAEGEYKVTAAYSGDANNMPSASLATLLRVAAVHAVDLAVHIARVQPEGASLPDALAASGGTLASYRIVVLNRGTLPASGVQLALMRSSGLQDLLWSCTAPPGGCTPPEGGIPLSTGFALAVGETAEVMLSGVVDGAAAFVELVAGARPPAGSPMAYPGDDTRFFYEAAGPDGLLKHGFE